MTYDSRQRLKQYLGFFNYGALPYAGGFYDQPYEVTQAFDLLRPLMAEHQEKQLAKQASKGKGGKR